MSSPNWLYALQQDPSFHSGLYSYQMTLAAVFSIPTHPAQPTNPKTHPAQPTNPKTVGVGARFRILYVKWGKNYKSVYSRLSAFQIEFDLVSFNKSYYICVVNNSGSS